MNDNIYVGNQSHLKKTININRIFTTRMMMTIYKIKKEILKD